MPPTLHARLSPSAAYRWTRCPGSQHLIENLPASEQAELLMRGDEYAQFGTLCHSAAEKNLKDGASVELDEEVLEMIEPYIAYIRSRLAEDSTLRMAVEQQVKATTTAMPEPYYGTPDCRLQSPAVLEIVDLKTGYVYVDPQDNEQLISYAGMALDDLQGLDAEQEVRLTIVQPRAGGVKTWYTTVDEVRKRYAAIAARMWDVKPGAPLVPGDHCRFCPARSHCPALRTQLATIAQDDFGLPATVAGPPPADLVPVTELATLISQGEVLEAWVKSLKDRAERELQAGHVVPGLKMVQKRARRVWVNEQEVEEWAARSGIMPSESHTLELKSPAQLEAVVGKKNLPKELYASVSSGLRLAFDNDPAPAAALGPAADFDDNAPNNSALTPNNQENK